MNFLVRVIVVAGTLILATVAGTQAGQLSHDVACAGRTLADGTTPAACAR